MVATTSSDMSVAIGVTVAKADYCSAVVEDRIAAVERRLDADPANVAEDD